MDGRWGADGRLCNSSVRIWISVVYFFVTTWEQINTIDYPFRSSQIDNSIGAHKTIYTATAITTFKY